MSFGRNLEKNNQKIMGNTCGICGIIYFAKFGKIKFCMQPEILEMYPRSGSRIQSTILRSDSDSAHYIMQILMLKSKTWDAMLRPSVRLSTDGCEALSAKIFPKNSEFSEFQNFPKSLGFPFLPHISEIRCGTKFFQI